MLPYSIVLLNSEARTKAFPPSPRFTLTDNKPRKNSNSAICSHTTRTGGGDKFDGRNEWSWERAGCEERAYKPFNTFRRRHRLARRFVSSPARLWRFVSICLAVIAIRYGYFSRDFIKYIKTQIRVYWIILLEEVIFAFLLGCAII